jgi:threonine aldolase
MAFQSDNIVGFSPGILDAMASISTGAMPPYGADPVTAGLRGAYGALFDHDLEIVPVVSGTAANALAIAAVSGPFNAVACYDNAHILQTENGASEFYTPGLRLLAVPGAEGKMDPAALEQVIARAMAGRGSSHVPSGISLTQLSEAGTAYTLEEITALTAVARRHGLLVHMDGARFANALVRLNCSPADLSWRAGVDVLSFGATKNGTMCADAIVFFRPALAEGFKRRLKRSGHDLSKLRFISVQLAAYLQDGLWLRNARQANDCAQMLSQGLRRLAGVRLLFAVDGNIMFAAMPNRLVASLTARGVSLRVRSSDHENSIIRFVTSFESTRDEIQALLDLIAQG